MKWVVGLSAMSFFGGILMMVASFMRPTPLPVIPSPDDPEDTVVVDPDFEGLRRVLIVYEADDKPAYPSSQVLILDSASFKSYLNEKCDEDGWRILDQDSNTAFMDDEWKRWMQMDRSELPWIIASNGESGTSGPLPKTIEETKKLIEDL